MASAVAGAEAAIISSGGGSEGALSGPMAIRTAAGSSRLRMRAWRWGRCRPWWILRSWAGSPALLRPCWAPDVLRGRVFVWLLLRTVTATGVSAGARRQGFRPGGGAGASAGGAWRQPGAFLRGAGCWVSGAGVSGAGLRDRAFFGRGGFRSPGSALARLLAARGVFRPWRAGSPRFRLVAPAGDGSFGRPAGVVTFLGAERGGAAGEHEAGQERHAREGEADQSPLRAPLRVPGPE